MRGFAHTLYMFLFDLSHSKNYNDTIRMKKYLGVFLLFVFAIVVAPFCMDTTTSVYAAEGTDTEFSERVKYFSTSSETGIFIMKDYIVTDDTEHYKGVVDIPVSGVLGRSKIFKYESVRETAKNDGSTEMSQTSLLLVHNSGVYTTQRMANFTLAKTAPVGKYGIRVTAYNYDEVTGLYSVAEDDGKPITTIYYIVHGEELSYIHFNGYIIDDKPVNLSTYDVRARGNGLRKTIRINLSVNAGAVYIEGTDTAICGNTVVGNLALNTVVGASNIYMEVQNSRGQVLNWNVISTLDKSVSVVDGMINISLPSSLATGTYVVKVWHSSNPSIYASFIIENGGGYVASGNAMGVMGSVMLVFGILLAISGGVLFFWPKVKNYLQESVADRQERLRFKKAGIDDKKAKEQVSRTAYENVKAITKELEESESLSEQKRKELLEQRNAEYKRTKTGGFLQKLHENRMKREYARDSGMSMDDFKEAEAKQKEVEDAKKRGLSALRNDGEGEEGGDATKEMMTQQQVDEVEAVAKAEEASRHAEMATGAQFELLDSVKNEAEYRESRGEERPDLQEVVKTHEAAKEEVEKEAGTGLLDRIRKFTGDE